MNIKTHSRKFAGKSAFASCYKVKALYNFAKRMRLIMKRFHRRCRRLCILAALLVLLVLFLRQNVLLDTASRHAILLDAQSGRVLAQKRADQHTAGQAGRNGASDGNADRRRQNRVYRRRRAVSGQPCHRERKRVHPCYACRARRPRDGAVQYPRCSACVPETSG